jgi:hypothetical protein
MHVPPSLFFTAAYHTFLVRELILSPCDLGCTVFKDAWVAFNRAYEVIASTSDSDLSFNSLYTDSEPQLKEILDHRLTLKPLGKTEHISSSYTEVC